MKYILIVLTVAVGLARSCPVDANGKPISIDYILARHELEEKNVGTVMAMMKDLFGNKNVEAIDKYVIEKGYIQHNPDIPDGRESIKERATEWFKGLPRSEFQLQRLAPNEDLVFVHWKSTELFGKVLSIVDIFRVENGKIVEHWDVIQEVPKDKKAANDHPFF